MNVLKRKTLLFAAAMMSLSAASTVAFACSAHDVTKAAISTPVNATIDPMTTAAHSDAEHVQLGDLAIKGFWARAMLPGQPVAGGFLSVTNEGATDDRLVSASSPKAGRMELHEMAMKEEVMVMREVAGGIAIAAGTTVELAPGGLHIMFMDVKEQFKVGDLVPVTLTFEKAGTVELIMPVMARDAGGDSAAHDHSKMHGAKTDHAQIDMSSMPDAEQIAHIMMGQFNTPENPLTVEPVVISGDHAIGSWSQDGKGGRALLRKADGKWTIHLCTGDAVKQAENLEKMGVPADDAIALAAALTDAEAKLGADKIAVFDSFEGTMMIEGEGHGQHKHGG